MADPLVILAVPKGGAAPTAADAALYDLRFQCSDLLHLVSGAIHTTGAHRDTLVRLALDRSAKLGAAINAVSALTGARS